METLTRRQGPRPSTTRGLPHMQLDQQPTDPSLRERLAERVFALPGVVEGPTGISVPGARALLLDRSIAHGPPEAFFIGGEFAHIHPGADHSMHICLDPEFAEAVCAAGWGEAHPLVAAGEVPPSFVLVYAPRDDLELGLVLRLVEASHRFASTGHRTRFEHPSRRSEEEPEPMNLTGFRHVGLTVSDLDRSAAWYVETLGFVELFRESEGQRTAVIMRVPGGDLVIGLVHFADGANDGFTPFRTGLDHLCFSVASRDAVNAWAAALDERGVPHSGVEEMKTGPILNFKDPDGIALAIAVPPPEVT